MDPFLIWLESTNFSIWMRESPSLLALPGILAVHTVGLGFAVGINVALDLRVLGIATQIPVWELKRLMPVMWFGFWLNAASGLALLVGYPTKALTNPVFYLKLFLIALALVMLKQIGRRVFAGPLADDTGATRAARLFAVASLVCWTGAIGAGRFLAYTYTRLMAID